MSPARTLSRTLLWVFFFGVVSQSVLAGLPSPHHRSLASGHGIFVGVGDAGISSSTDGVHWQLRLPSPIPGDTSFGRARFLNGRFVAVGTRGLLFTSDDGVTWTRRSVPVSVFGANAGESAGKPMAIWDVAYGNGRYVAGGQAQFFTSTDAVTWTRQFAAAINYDVFELRFGGGQFLILGPSGHVALSPDGLAWRDVAIPNGPTFRQAGYGSQGWVALAYDGIFVVGGSVWTSTDGQTWQKAAGDLPVFTAGTPQSYYDVQSVEGRYYIPSTGGILTSTDGQTFTIAGRGRANQQFTTLTAGGGVLLAGGYRGNINDAVDPYLNSADGTHWTDQPLPVLTLLAAPQSRAVVAGDPVVFAVEPSLEGADFQWLRDGTPLVGQTEKLLYLSDLSTGDAARYAVRVSRGGVVVESAAASLLVRPVGSLAAADLGRIANLSVRTQAGAGDSTLIVGFVVSGGTSGATRALLMRGAGPLLTRLGVGSALSDPRITVYRTGGAVANNDDWGGRADLGALFSRLGATAFDSPASKDAAIADAVVRGVYSLHVTGGGGQTGVALAEIYDAATSAELTAASPRLVNVSARSGVGVGENILIAGFVVSGESPRTLLVRALGPTLRTLGVAGELLDPKLVLYAGGNEIARNDNWMGLAAIRRAAARVGAYEIDGATKDAALLLTLAPGVYSTHVSGVGDTTGIALVEVYEVD